MKNFYAFVFSLALLIGTSNFVSAAEGDTTVVQAHDEVHWNWNGNFYDTVQFPQNGPYQKVIMHYIIGCPSIGCSEWDYTTRILLWDPINTADKYELAKVITPYAGDKNQGWFHEYKFDVTHLAPLFTGDKVINARYDGWQDGFTITVFFEFIEGTPPRDVLQVDQVYYGGYTYGNSNNPINVALQEDTISKNAATNQVEFIMTATGHGFGNNNGNGINPDNCAEFCDKYYKVLVNGGSAVQQTVWRNDCGSEPLYAQTGTWVYNRAGWCPGSEGQTFVHDITDNANSGNEFRVKVNWENYTATNVSMSYNISGQVIQYGAPNHNLDAEVMDVLNPSKYDRYSRYNPTAQPPTIVLRNTGATDVYSIKLKYGVEGGTFYTTTWNGDLKFMETYEAKLPIPDHNFFKGSGSQVMIVEILEVNGVQDEVSSNNIYRSPFEKPTRVNGPFMLQVKSNARGYENWYMVTNSMGDTIVYRNNLSNNTTYVDTLDLPKGAYTFYIEDNGGDGLSWWANSAQGTGSAQMRNVGVPNSQAPIYVNTLEPDFGNFLVYNFSVGYDIVAGNPDYDETAWAPPGTIGIAKVEMKETKGSFSVYPNPAQNEVNIESVSMEGRSEIKVYSQTGSLVYQGYLEMFPGFRQSVDMTNWSSGIYYVTVSNGYQMESQMLMKK
jgi:hypothetical protein